MCGSMTERRVCVWKYDREKGACGSMTERGGLCVEVRLREEGLIRVLDCSFPRRWKTY